MAIGDDDTRVREIQKSDDLYRITVEDDDMMARESG